MSRFFTEEYKGYRTNPDTGEIMEFSEHKSVQLKKAEPFFQVYSQQILALYSTDVMNATTKVLYKMLEYAEWNTGKVFMTTDRVEEIMTSCNISRASYHRGVKELIDKGIIIKGKGSYTIAENMYWKGDLKMREDIIKAKMKVTFTPVLEDEIQEKQED
jgi:predicted transcriptional regulator